jgi:hypothetical protein
MSRATQGETILTGAPRFNPFSRQRIAKRDFGLSAFLVQDRGGAWRIVPRVGEKLVPDAATTPNGTPRRFRCQ